MRLRALSTIPVFASYVIAYFVPLCGFVVLLISVFVLPTFVALWIRLGSDGRIVDKRQLSRHWIGSTLLNLTFAIPLAVLFLFGLGL